MSFRWSTENSVMECEYHVRQGQEIADVLRRRKVDIACVHDVRWKGSNARNVVHGYTHMLSGRYEQYEWLWIILREERTKDIL